MLHEKLPMNETGLTRKDNGISIFVFSIFNYAFGDGKYCPLFIRGTGQEMMSGLYWVRSQKAEPEWHQLVVKVNQHVGI